MIDPAFDFKGEQLNDLALSASELAHHVSRIDDLRFLFIAAFLLMQVEPGRTAEDYLLALQTTARKRGFMH